MSASIERAIESENWSLARKLIRAALRTEPDSHWLLTRLSLTYYEERSYQRSLDLSMRALALAPSCPLALWDAAGSLDMLSREREAVSMYRSLIRRGVSQIAFGPCGEGLAWSRGLVADCWYRIAVCYQRVGRRKLSQRAIQQHLAMRGPGCQSAYPLRQVRLEFGVA